MKKNIVIILIVLLVILASVILIAINKNDNQSKTDNNIENNISDFKTEKNVNNGYTIYDKGTNEVRGTVNDESELKIYIDDPNYSPHLLSEEYVENSL